MAYKTSACLILLSLIYAPWALGCVQPWAIHGLIVLNLAAGAFLILQWRRPAIHRLTLFCVAGLLVQGWVMVFIANDAVDREVRGETMWQITGILIAMLVATDMAARGWSWQMLTFIGGTGISIAIYGLLAKVGVLPELAHRVYRESVFATFDYHGNAGAYLNLAIPAVFAMAMRKQIGGWAGLSVCVAALLVNVSRAAAAIGVILLIGLTIWAAGRLARRSHRQLAAGLGVAIIVAAVAGGAAWRRWDQLSSMASADNPRLLLIQMALPMVRDAGFFGDGPGSFKLIYPTSPYLPHEIYRRTIVTPYKIGTEVSIYSHVHNDYLQYLIEWGWIGGILWALLVVGAVWRGITAYRRGIADRLLTIACLAALAGVLLHALVDWPLQVASLQLDVAVYLAILAGQPCAYS
jgi:hypothetical protein